MFKELAKPPKKLNKTRGIGIIAAPPQLVADVITYDYEQWDDNMRGFKTLSEERDAESGAIAETSWSRYGLGARTLCVCEFIHEARFSSSDAQLHLPFARACTAVRTAAA